MKRHSQLETLVLSVEPRKLVTLRVHQLIKAHLIVSLVRACDLLGRETALFGEHPRADRWNPEVTGKSLFIWDADDNLAHIKHMVRRYGSVRGPERQPHPAGIFVAMKLSCDAFRTDLTLTAKLSLPSQAPVKGYLDGVGGEWVLERERNGTP